MGKITKKGKVLIGVGVVLLLGAAIISAYLLLWNPDTEESDPENNQEETLVYLDPKTPLEIEDYFIELAETQNWKETESIDNSQIKVRINPDSTQENSINIYQIWFVTKPWARLGDSDNLDNLKITKVSDKITYKHLDEYFELAETAYDTSQTNKPSNGYKLQTLQELDGTEQVVGTPFEDIKNYENYLHINIDADESTIKKLTTELKEKLLQENNYLMNSIPEQEEFVSVIKTGTSVIGGPGWTLCERKKGLGYPIQEVSEFLTNADITLISNEASFVEGCTQEAGTTAFCGKPSYLQNLESIDADIISLTGNHMCDYGRSPFESTLETYTQNNMEYFAAGKNEAESWEPLIIETEAGTIAFVGYNKMGPNGVLATENLAGTAYYDEAKFKDAMNQASLSADIIWVDTHLWPEYGTTPTNDQIDHSQEAVDFGADIVTGVSSHETQSMDFYNGKPVFYGLGNFLFDQMWSTETRRGIVLKVYIYDGEIRDIKVHPTQMYDYCQPRFTEGEENDEILKYFVDISELE